MIKSLKGAGALALVCGLGSLTAAPALAARTSSRAHGSAASGRSTVPLGIDAAALPGATVFGTTRPNTAETVSFIFKEANLSQLEAQAQSGFSAPYMSVKTFAKTYGASPKLIGQLQSYLAGYGISTTVYPNNLDVVATGTAGAFDSALAVTQLDYHTPAVQGPSGTASIPAQSFHAPTSSPSLPSDIADQLVAILGLTNYAPSVSNAVHVSQKLATAAGTAANRPGGCAVLSGLPSDCNLPQNFTAQYGLDPLYGMNATGQGQTLGIITLATVDPGAPQHFWSKVAGINRTGSLTFDNVDGGAGAPSYNAGSGETDLDIEQSGAVAPGANIVVYTAPNTDSGFIDAFFTAASQNVAGSVSCSWGEAETVIQSIQALGQESSGYVQAFDEAMLEFDAQGQASFIASGDGGAYDAYGEFPGATQPTNLSIDNPSDSPYTTAAGGTTLPWNATFAPGVSVDVKAQRIWAWDYLWAPVAQLYGISLQASAEAQVVGSGGGFSAIETQPSYQQNVNGTNSFTAVPYLTPQDPVNTTSIFGINLPSTWTFNGLSPTLTSGTGSGRATPDLAADADPYTGYILYAPSNDGKDGIHSPTQAGWGGTSFVAPQLNGSAAVIDSYLAAKGMPRTGFWNPMIYQFAQSTSSPFTSLNTPGTTNDNLYYTGTAGATFVPGAGLGTPDLSQLAIDFANGGK
ncbi:MAG: S53 family peptidase [Actinomycetota bacterium]|nr:S53 family peptidase [Actinomycetota bacterium]